MKTRTGFVSNSSSSSFIVYGVSVEDDMDKMYRLVYDAVDHEVLQNIEYAVNFTDELKEEYDNEFTYEAFVDSIECEYEFREAMEYGALADVLPGGISLLCYGDYDRYVGIALGFSREDLFKPKFTEEEINKIDKALKEFSSDQPSIHEGEYYC